MNKYFKNDGIIKIVYFGYKIYYRGIFIYKNNIGNKAIELFTESIANGNPDFSGIKGNYAIWFTNIDTHEHIAFPDNSGIFRLYYFDNQFGFSFLSLIQKLPSSKLKFNANKIVEFLQLGFIHSNKTLIENINLLPRDKFCYKKQMVA